MTKEQLKAQRESWTREARNLELAIMCGVIYVKPGHQVKDLADAGVEKEKLGMIPASDGKIARQEEKLEVLRSLIGH